jgi:hypothetical protein
MALAVDETLRLMHGNQAVTAGLIGGFKDFIDGPMLVTIL